MKGKPLVDKRGKPKLQLKGRIFMQNVTDIVSASKQGMFSNATTSSFVTTDNSKGSYTCQIFWKGDPGIENFTIRFLTEDIMQKWYNTLLEQKSRWTNIARMSDSGRPSTSATEFTYMQAQNLENPYQQKHGEEEDDEFETNTVVSPDSHASYPSASSWTASNSSLRSRAATNDSGPVAPGVGRMAPPRFAPGSMPAPHLFLKTGQPNNSPASPAPNFAESYFSPVEESPMSSRTSAASSHMYFNQQGSHSGSGHERYTAPLPYRSGSREAMNGYPQNARASGRAAAYSQGPSSQSGSGNRNRSASSPNMNEANRRVMNSARPPMPEGPMPSHMQHSAAAVRAQNNSPHLSNGGIDERLGAGSPFDRERSQSRPYGDARFNTNPSSRSITPVTYNSVSPPLSSATPTLSDMGMQLLPPPSQLKVKVHATAAGQVLTLVVPSNIAYQSLRDRIDAKLQRSTNISLTDKGGNQVKLKYLDDEDLVIIASDEDVQTAFETWREQRGEGITGMGEIELFCQ